MANETIKTNDPIKNIEDNVTETNSAAILAKIIAAPATEAKQLADGHNVVVAISALPSGAATAAKQVLQPVATQLPAALGQGAMALSLKVAIANDQSAVPISAAALPLPAGATTETTLVNQADGTKIYLGDAWRTIAVAKFIRPAGAAGDIVAAVAGQIVYVIGWQFSCDTDATTFKFNDSTPADLTNAQTFMKGGGEVVFPYKTLLLKTAVATSLQGTATVGQVTGTVWYCQF